jgi:hypothetical protein
MFISKRLMVIKYKISDALGGWYEFGRKLGVAYAAPGHEFTANNIASK